MQVLEEVASVSLDFYNAVLSAGQGMPNVVLFLAKRSLANPVVRNFVGCIMVDSHFPV